MKRDYVLLVKGRSSDNGSMLYDFPQTENIIIQDTESEPDNFMLEQNYPNPFNPVTTIRYTLSGDQFVNLKIFNAQGKEVAELINATEKSGSHEVKFDGSNMPSGVYYYRLKTNGFMKIRKMVILK